MASRRTFIRQLSWAAVPLVLTPRHSQEPIATPKPQASGGAIPADTLAFPIGANTKAVGPLDNDPTVIGIERRLGCVCGCTLDVYTCRTTDFSCTFSPAMHAKVVEQFERNAKPQEIIDWFLAQPESTFGHKVLLMAPEPRGFNLVGYIVPGLTVTALGLVLAAWLSRTRTKAEVLAAGPNASVTGAPDAEQLVALKRALDDVES